MLQLRFHIPDGSSGCLMNMSLVTNIHCGASPHSLCFVLFSSSGYQLVCTVAVVSAKHEVKPEP